MEEELQKIEDTYKNSKSKAIFIKKPKEVNNKIGIEPHA